MANWNGATLRNRCGPALNAHSLHVEQNMLLAGFEAVGSDNHGVINLEAAHIGGQLFFDASGVRNEDQSHSSVLVMLDGLTYSGLPQLPPSTPWHKWLSMLRETTGWYAPQPYQQLAAAHRAAGHDRHARLILMEQRRDQIRRGDLSRPEQAWARLTGLTLGYGYQPWRALLFLLAVVLLAVGLALWAGDNGGLARTSSSAASSSACTTVEKVGVGLDIGLPLVKTGSQNRCTATDTGVGQAITVAGWALQLAAWAFATLFVAGFTSAVRKP
jgi:hypothetical protein